MNPDDSPRTLSPDRVEWVPSSPDAIEVRVFGSWHGPTVPPPAVLVVGDERIAELGAPPGDDVPPAWSAAFLVPVELRSAVEGGDASLEVSGLIVGLPLAQPGRMVAPAAEIGTVIDPAVLAERRARRAEIAEQSATERATTAEQAASTLRAQLVHLEERLARAAEERDALAARVADAERRLRLAEQREEAERRRRGELEEELAAERRSVEQEVHDLSDRLASAEEVTEALERELVTARRREEAERVAREAVDRQLREALDRVASLEGASGDEREELRRQAAVLSDRLAEAEAERARLQGLAADLEHVRVRLVEAEAERGDADELARRLAEAEASRDELARRISEAETSRTDADELARRLAAAEAERDELRARVGAAPAVGAGELEALQAEIAELRRRLEETEAALKQERAAHATAERARQLAAQRTQEERAAREAAERRGGGDPSARERELAGQVAALEEEIAGRAATHRRVQEAIEAVRSELERVRAQVRQTPSASAPEIQALTERVQLLEDLVRQRDAELETTRQALGEAERAAEAARLRGATDADTLREGFEARVRELSAAVAEMRRRLRETTSDFEARLDAERRRREAAETALEQLRAATRAEAAVAAAARVEPAPASQRVEAEPSHDPSSAEVETSGAPDAPHEVPPSADVETTVAPEASGEAEALSDDDALDALIAGLREQVDSAREQLRVWDEPPTPATPAAEPGDTTTERLRAIEADIRAAVPDPEASVPAREIIASLQQAADRLRAAAEEELANIEADEAAGHESAASVEADEPAADEPLGRVEADESAGDEPVASVEADDRAEAPVARMGADGDEPAARVEDVGAHDDEVEVELTPPAALAIADVARETPRRATPSASATPSAVPAAVTSAASPRPAATPAGLAAVTSAVPTQPAATPAGPVALGPRSVDFGAGESPWLRTAIERLSRSEPARAAELLVALLPAQAMAGVDLTYVLTAPTLGALRVVLSDGTVQVERGPSSLTADARISGSLATLAPLVAGGGGWRATRGVRIDGARRPARKLLRRRRPVGLGDFAALTPPPEPGLVLAALAAAVDPAWTRGHRFGVVYEIGDERWTVLAEDGAPLTLSDAEGPHAATVSLPAEAFLPALQGAASTATVAGDRRAADVLHAWFDRARGVTAG